MKGNYYAHGKVLLTGEYAVLDGAKAIALPTKKGQSLTFKQNKGSDIVWKAYDHLGEEWFSAKISLFDFAAIKTTDEETAQRLKKLLKNAVRLNSEFLSKWNGFKVETRLEFPNNWGLGSSSTLTYLVAQWADVHPLLLHFKNSNGSGYDVACAGADGPIYYKLEDGTINWEEIDYNPSFKKHLHFVHLGKKQSSEDGIKYYSKTVKKKAEFVKESNQMATEMERCTSLKGFIKLIAENELMVSKALKLETCKSTHFSDFNGEIKSLGAWGGDFVLAASEMDSEDVKAYFAKKGFDQCLSYDEFVL
ncbi:GYDIA family GHMP kinase [Portibacter lacus]|uniref:GYDIA family GHMP kinase n=1 Tax=Portibacter lacus TaxID=1099794 RepID=UPI0024E138AA|nr:GYDIA family GHMP kinase [Portibacter lacus]